MNNNIRIYNENEPQYKLLQGFANYLNAHTTDRYNFRLENMLFSTNWYYTGITTEDTKTGDMWQTCTPKAYVTILRGEEYFSLAAHDVFEIHEWTNPPASSYDLTQVDPKLLDNFGGAGKISESEEEEDLQLD